jgi:prepilin-type N-terminal cleavage/methylation domain-containing protein
MRDVRGQGHSGFTAIELVAALVIVGVGTALAWGAYNGFLRRSAAQRAAEVFASDLALARATAIRSRAPVTILFDEGRLVYVLRAADGTVLLRRSFGRRDDLRLDQIELAFAGDSVRFDARGFADLSGAGGAVGEAAFRNRGEAYAVRFNALGTAKVVRP